MYVRLLLLSPGEAVAENMFDVYAFDRMGLPQGSMNSFVATIYLNFRL